MKLGIDFGTTRTVVAAAVKGRYPVVSFDVNGTFCDYLPGVVVQQGTTLTFGWEAVQLLRSGASLTGAVRSIKRAVSQLPPDDPVPGLDGISALDLTTGFLSHVRRMLIEAGNLKLKRGSDPEVMVSVPANASTRQRYTTLEAYARAGFDVIGVINEPSAAAVEFAFHNTEVLSPRSPKRYVMVYDLGGGTFDAAALSLEDRRFDLLATEGIARLGGDDFDALLCSMTLEEAGIAPGALDPIAEQGVLDACREAKEALRPAVKKMLIELAPHVEEPESVVLPTADVYERSAPLVSRSLDLLDQVFVRLAGKGIDPENQREFAGVYLVGGAVSFPGVQRQLRERFKRKVIRAAQPHASTAIGLAVTADPEAGIMVREAVTRHFGVWREAQGGREKCFDLILDKDAAVSDGPLVVTRSYNPTHSIGELRFLECSTLSNGGQPAGDLTPWDRIRFPYDPALADEKELSALPVESRPDLAGDAIVETYTYAQDGSVTVAIQNATHGYVRNYKLGARQ